MRLTCCLAHVRGTNALRSCLYAALLPGVQVPARILPRVSKGICRTQCLGLLACTELHV